MNRRHLLIEQIIRKGTPAVRRGDRDEAGDLEARLQLADHVPRVQAAHAVRDDVDRRAGGDLRVDVVEEGRGAVGDGGARGHAGGDDGAAGRGEGFGDAAPVLDGREGGDEVQLGEAEEAVGEDDGVFGCRYRISQYEVFRVG